MLTTCQTCLSKSMMDNGVLFSIKYENKHRGQPIIFNKHDILGPMLNHLVPLLFSLLRTVNSFLVIIYLCSISSSNNKYFYCHHYFCFSRLCIEYFPKVLSGMEKNIDCNLNVIDLSTSLAFR